MDNDIFGSVSHDHNEASLFLLRNRILDESSRISRVAERKSHLNAIAYERGNARVAVERLGLGSWVEMRTLGDESTHTCLRDMAKVLLEWKPSSNFVLLASGRREVLSRPFAAQRPSC